MSYKDITAGDKVGRLLGARYIIAKTGNQAIELAFSFVEPSSDTNQRLLKRLWLTKNGLKHTMDTLELLGFAGEETPDANGVIPRMTPDGRPNFNFDQDVQLVVDFGEPNDKGVSYAEIKYVNRIGGSGFASAEVNIIQSKLNEIGFKAEFLSRKANKGQMPPAPPEFAADESLPY